ncbi:hypothetical protein M0802_005337 [Mischocyttarus mexicanus]|nr:hypothetical protein M0802_005337 [Mischocyttarus mexicanus]
MFNNNLETSSMEITHTDECGDDMNVCILKCSKLMNKFTDHKFNTIKFLLRDTLQLVHVFVDWYDVGLMFTLISDNDKKVNSCKIYFLDIKIFHNNNEISYNFQRNESNQCVAYCNTQNNLDFYNYELLHFEFHLKYILKVSECITPKKNELYGKLHTIYVEKKFTDLKIYVKGKEFLAHKVIICMNSKLASMLDNNNDEVKKNVIDINNLEPEIFEIILNYIYVGETSKISFEMSNLPFLFDLILAADEYMLIDLKKKLIEIMVRHIAIINIFDMLLFAHKYNIVELKNKCAHYISLYRKDISQMELFKQIVYENSTITGELLYYTLQNNSSHS